MFLLNPDLLTSSYGFVDEKDVEYIDVSSEKFYKFLIEVSETVFNIIAEYCESDFAHSWEKDKFVLIPLNCTSFDIDDVNNKFWDGCSIYFNKNLLEALPEDNDTSLFEEYTIDQIYGTAFLHTKLKSFFKRIKDYEIHEMDLFEEYLLYSILTEYSDYYDFMTENGPDCDPDYEEDNPMGYSDEYLAFQNTKKLELSNLFSRFYKNSTFIDKISTKLSHMEFIFSDEHDDIINSKFFDDFDFLAIFSESFAHGIDIIKSSTGAYMDESYNYDHVVSIFENCGLKAKITAIGTKEAYNIEKTQFAEENAKNMMKAFHEAFFPMEDFNPEFIITSEDEDALDDFDDEDLD